MGINRLYWGGSSGSGFLLTLRSTTPVFLLLNIPNIFLSKPLPTKSQKQQNSALETDLAWLGWSPCPGYGQFYTQLMRLSWGSVGWSLWRGYHMASRGSRLGSAWHMGMRRPERWPYCTLGMESVGGRWPRPGRVADRKTIVLLTLVHMGPGVLSYLMCLQRSGIVWAQLARLAIFKNMCLVTHYCCVNNTPS